MVKRLRVLLQSQDTTIPEKRKSTQLSKRALSSLDVSPFVPAASNEGVDLPLRPKKHAKTKASPSLTLPSEGDFLNSSGPSKPDIPSSDPLDLISKEPTIIAEVPPLAVTGSSSLPLSMSSTVSNMNTLLVETLLWSSLQEIKKCPLPDLAAKIIVVRDCAIALRVVSYDKETFDQFEALLKDLEYWGVEILQRESEVQALLQDLLGFLRGESSSASKFHEEL
ncbi:hypothetical protein AMTR_s00021p00140800 [Amborella trichopoda]|uniref:Uncharacterized protein n=1 Tax=Amborella trichopoda TaxID=13333 RepID=W1Q0Z9_AMBTC|nr:hypothetical protein AMTR_s00021p00140800 [Amborella trichopoda]